MKKLFKIAVSFMLVFTVFSSLTKDTSAATYDFSVNGNEVITGSNTSGTVDNISWEVKNVGGRNVLEFGEISRGSSVADATPGSSFALIIGDTDYDIVFSEDIEVFAADAYFYFLNTSNITFNGDVTIYSKHHEPLFFQAASSDEINVTFNGQVNLTNTSILGAICTNNIGTVTLTFNDTLEITGDDTGIIAHSPLNLNVTDATIKANTVSILNVNYNPSLVQQLNINISGTMNLSDINGFYSTGIDSQNDPVTITMGATDKLNISGHHKGIAAESLTITGGKTAITTSVGLDVSSVTLNSAVANITSELSNENTEYSEGGIIGTDLSIELNRASMSVAAKHPAVIADNLVIALKDNNSNLSLISDFQTCLIGNSVSVVSSATNPLVIKSSTTANISGLKVESSFDDIDLDTAKVIQLSTSIDTSGDGTGSNTGGNNNGGHTDNNNSGNNDNVVQTSDTTDLSITYSLLGISLLSLVLLKKKQYN